MRKPNLADLVKIEGMHTGIFDLPDLGNRELVHSEITDDGRSATFVKLTTEVTLIVDPTLSDIQKAKRIQDHFYSVKSILPTNDTHAFVMHGGEHFANLLIRHFGFTRAAGIPLYWRRNG